MIKSSTRAKLMDEMCIFGTGGPLTLGLKNPQNPCNSVLPDGFAVFLNAKKIKPPVESPFLCQNHMELTSPTHPTKSLPRTQTWQVPLNVDF